MEHEINTDAAAGAAASAAATVATTVETVVETKAAAEAAAPAASVLISCFIFIVHFVFLMLDLKFDFYFVKLFLHVGVVTWGDSADTSTRQRVGVIPLRHYPSSVSARINRRFENINSIKLQHFR